MEYDNHIRPGVLLFDDIETSVTALYLAGGRQKVDKTTSKSATLTNLCLYRYTIEMCAEYRDRCYHHRL